MSNASDTSSSDSWGEDEMNDRVIDDDDDDRPSNSNSQHTHQYVHIDKDKLQKLKQYMEDSDDDDDEYDWGDDDEDSDEEELDLNAKLMLSAAKQTQHEHDQEWARDIDEKSLQQEAEQRHRERQIRIKIEPYLKQLDMLRDVISNGGDLEDMDLDLMEMCRGIMVAHSYTKIMESVVSSRIAGHLHSLFDFMLKVNYSETMAQRIEPVIHLLRACVKISIELQEAFIYCGLFPRIYEHLRMTRNRDSFLALAFDFCVHSEQGVKLFVATGGINEVILPFIAKGSHYLDICLGILSQIQCLHVCVLLLFTLYYPNCVCYVCLTRNWSPLLDNFDPYPSTNLDELTEHNEYRNPCIVYVFAISTLLHAITTTASSSGCQSTESRQSTHRHTNTDTDRPIVRGIVRQ